MQFTTLHTFDTEYSADSIEWCPQYGYRSYFVCGTYQLDDDSADVISSPYRRKGRIYLFKFAIGSKDLTELQRLETEAILDMKWLPTPQGKPILATANALGEVNVYCLEDDKLISLTSLNLCKESEIRMALSLDSNWSSEENVSSSSCKILVSDSQGSITLIDYSPNGELLGKHTWSSHSYEAWTCAFDKWKSNIAYTGGDDNVLYAYDLRSYERTLINRSHTAGITCLLSHPKREHVLLTGSYDERLRSFDTRSMKHPVGELNLNGGIWRLKPDPLNRDLILSACMYQNFSIVKLINSNLSLKLVGEYNEHKSICYGADWCLNFQQNNEELFTATCSFYDHKLCIASVKENE